MALGNPFGSNFEGPFSLEQRMELLALMVGRWHDAGIAVKKVSFLDAMGWNMPHEVRETIAAIRERWPEVETFHMHLHNTRGATMASFYEALTLGATEFDTSIGGMGGCPYCGNGRAAGHVPTEDFVHMCHEMGIETGYDLDKLIEAAAIAEEVVGASAVGARLQERAAPAERQGPVPAEHAVRGIPRGSLPTSAVGHRCTKGRSRLGSRAARSSTANAPARDSGSSRRRAVTTARSGPFRPDPAGVMPSRAAALRRRDPRPLLRRGGSASKAFSVQAVDDG